MESAREGKLPDPNININPIRDLAASSDLVGKLSSEKEGQPENIEEERDSLFFKKINSFSPEAVEFIAGLSNMFLEEDIYRQYKNDPFRLENVSNSLKSEGLGEEDVKVVMNYFSFSSAEEDKKK